MTNDNLRRERYSSTATRTKRSRDGKISKLVLRLPVGQLSRAADIWFAVLCDPKAAARIIPRAPARRGFRAAFAIVDSVVKPRLCELGGRGRPPTVTFEITPKQARTLLSVLTYVLDDDEAARFVLPISAHRQQTRKVERYLTDALAPPSPRTMFRTTPGEPDDLAEKTRADLDRVKSTRAARAARRRARGDRFKR